MFPMSGKGCGPGGRSTRTNFEYGLHFKSRSLGIPPHRATNIPLPFFWKAVLGTLNARAPKAAILHMPTYQTSKLDAGASRAGLPFPSVVSTDGFTQEQVHSIMPWERERLRGIVVDDPWSRNGLVRDTMLQYLHN
ncbi:hypothetical protein LWI28_022330 [Acer negundo]|uniref:Uncharacterized protein n=1 Tax=Acer negundo TaxID=4023 RepID=A0AAD5NVC2_ACENE|nr:hypothetical protein LWI28_022330 [Acer negundo]